MHGSMFGCVHQTCTIETVVMWPATWSARVNELIDLLLHVVFALVLLDLLAGRAAC